MSTPMEMMGGMVPPPMDAMGPMGAVQPGGLVSPTGEVPVFGETIPEEDLIKGDVQDWQGGRPINLKKTLKSGKTVGETLSSHLKTTLDQELKNQEGVIQKIKRAHKLYKAEKGLWGARPKPWMADISIPVARKISDTIFVRIQDMVWNKLRIFVMKARGTGTKEINEKIAIWEKAFNHYVKNDLHLKEKMVFPTRQAVNSGTGVAKIVYETKNKTIYRYASEEDKLDTTVKKYRVPGTKETVVKEPSIVFRGPNVYPIDRARFVISSDALSIDDAYICGFSFDRRKSQLDAFAAKKIYDADAVKKLTTTKAGEMTELRATSAGMVLDKTTYTEPYTLYELWLGYDVDGDGEEDDIAITFHKESGQILKAIYNPIFYGYRPFADMKGASQVEYTYDGEGICEIVECMAEELDSLHNLMLDRMKLLNLPIMFARKDIGLDNYELEPGKIKCIDDDPSTAIFIVPQPDITFSIMNEVPWLVTQMEQACGITQLSLGISTAERPVAKETLMVGDEGNKKFKSWTERAREFYNETGYKVLEAMAQYQPTYEYTDEGGARQSVEMPTGNIRDYLNLDLAVASEEWNMTMRREVMLMQYQLVKDYLTGAMGAVQVLTSPMAPSDAKKYIVQANDISSRLLNRIMENFESTEPDSMNVDIRKSIDVEKCIQNSVDIIQAAQQAEMAAQGAAKQEADQMIMAQGGMPPEMGGEEQGGGQPQGAQPQTKEGNTAFTLNLREGNKGK